VFLRIVFVLHLHIYKGNPYIHNLK